MAAARARATVRTRAARPSELGFLGFSCACLRGASGAPPPAGRPCPRAAARARATVRTRAARPSELGFPEISSARVRGTSGAPYQRPRCVSRAPNGGGFKELIYSAARTVASLSMAVGRVALSCPHQSSWLCCWALAISFAVWSTKWWNQTKAATRPTTMGPYGCDLPVAGSTGRRPNVPIASAATTPITTACGGGGRLALGRRRASVGSRARAGRARARARRFLLVFLRSVSVALVVSRGGAGRHRPGRRVIAYYDAARTVALASVAMFIE